MAKINVRSWKDDTNTEIVLPSASHGEILDKMLDMYWEDDQVFLFSYTPVVDKFYLSTTHIVDKELLLREYSITVVE